MNGRPELVLIAAMDRERAIGRAGELLWHEPNDQRHFRAATLGHPVVMGRKTWDSLPARFRPLPGRRNLVVTRNPLWQAAGAEAVTSLAAALERAGDASRVVVIGGAELYALALPAADTLLLTETEHRFDGADAHFPAFDRSVFREVAREARVGADGTPYAFVRYERQRSDG